MSKRHRQIRRARRDHLDNVIPLGNVRGPQLEADYEWATSPGCCIDDPGEIEKVKQLTHDEVIRLTADDRVGGVRWLHWHGEAARAELAALYGDNELSQQLDAFLEQHGEHGVLIVAAAPCRPGTAAAHGKPLQD